MQSFLIDADARQGESERVRLWVAEIRDLAYDAEDVVETFALRIVSKRKGGFSNVVNRYACILKEGWMLHKIRSEIEKIITKITDLRGRLQTYGIKELRVGEGSSSSNERRESRRPYPHIIDDNIIALDSDIKKLVSVLVDEESDYRVISIRGMGGVGKTALAKKRWNSIKPAFSMRKTSSKILFTSRNKEVASHADRRGYLHELECLNEENSWELVYYRADTRMEELGKDMLKHCAGLPLAIIVLGGILATNHFVNGESHFLEDYEIPANRLIQLWVAEGIISSNQNEINEGEIAVDVAERVLDFEVDSGAMRMGCKLPSDIGKSHPFEILESKGSKLLQVKVAIISGQWQLKVRIPNVIWRTEQLRHLYLPENCKQKTKLKLGTLRNLQTLVNFNTKSYAEDLLNMTNLRELEIR
ncbi:hypothetical protein CRYUN_Cryun39dG0041300 [Craigia yunnanensis]